MERFQVGDLVIATMGYKSSWHGEEVILGRLYKVIKSDSYNYLSLDSCFTILVHDVMCQKDLLAYYPESIFEFVD